MSKLSNHLQQAVFQHQNMRSTAVRTVFSTSRTRSGVCSRCYSSLGNSENETSAYTWLNDADLTTATTSTSASETLKGKRIAIKDNIYYRGAPSTCSSEILKDFEPPFTATCVQALLESGAYIYGKTQMDEFGMGSNTTNLPNGSKRVTNPYPGPGPDARSAGGSSGGSAVAVAEGSVYAALGTDTGGSVRLPASYCGIVGLKPSYGMISRHGVVSYADSLDCVGVLARDIDAVQTVFEVISRPDSAFDATCATEDKRRRVQRVEKRGIDGLRIGIPIETSATPPSRALLKYLKSNGATLQAISLPSTPHALAAYYTIATAEASSSLARFGGGWWGKKRELFGEEVKKRLLAGTWALTADAFNNYYLKALHLRTTLRKDYDAVYNSQHGEGVDVILHPTTPSIAPLSESAGPGYEQDVLTAPASLAGLPALSVPCGLEEGWPRGVSLIGPWGHESLLLDIGRHIEAFNRDHD